MWKTCYINIFKDSLAFKIKTKDKIRKILTI